MTGRHLCYFMTGQQTPGQGRARLRWSSRVRKISSCSRRMRRLGPPLGGRATVLLRQRREWCANEEKEGVLTSKISGTKTLVQASAVSASPHILATPLMTAVSIVHVFYFSMTPLHVLFGSALVVLLATTTTQLNEHVRTQVLTCILTCPV